ncbi:nuclear and cytoplasmic polyadenylated RNA-binding protein pub1 [Dipodascopsis tothii]|uniref:nuclear and cytoplasmic polyadenylated RNA-binding protein pub1 n=1 Tax=Dipodascopsis tothii TaxID=44089 RepID=UPI0034CEFA69
MASPAPASDGPSPPAVPTPPAEDALPSPPSPAEPAAPTEPAEPAPAPPSSPPAPPSTPPGGRNAGGPAAPTPAAVPATAPAPAGDARTPPPAPGGGVATFQQKSDVNKRVLYVGGLDPRVSEPILREIFEVAGHVLGVKIIPDKSHKGFNYGFVEYDDPNSAQAALQTLNGRHIHQSEIKINWAYQSHAAGPKEDTSNHYHIFVGDLSNEVTDEILSKGFSRFASMSEARVMWDLKTGRSRGYGFVSFRDLADAEKAKSTMDGEWLGSRAIRCNWANQRGAAAPGQAGAYAGMPATPAGPANGLSYDVVVQQSPAWQTTVYIGNLSPYTTQADLVPMFQSFGYVYDVKLQNDRGYAFVKLDTHEAAAMAIVQLSGIAVNGRQIRCSWGKDTRGIPGPPGHGMPASPGPYAAGYAGYYAQYGQGADMYAGYPPPGPHVPHHGHHGPAGNGHGGYGRQGSGGNRYYRS